MRYNKKGLVMDCPSCKDPINLPPGQRIAHLVINKTQDEQGNGHVHTHGDIHLQTHTREMLELAAESCNVALGKHNALDDVKEVVLHNRQRIGDMLVFTCGVRDFKAAFPHIKVGVCPTAAHIFDHNPNVAFICDKKEFEKEIGGPEVPMKRVGDRVYLRIGPGAGTNQSNRVDWHFTNAYRMSIEQGLNIHIPQGESRPDIYFTREEFDAPPIFDRPYWIICTAGERGWGCKMYPFVKWQEFVNQNPDHLFVQIGTKGDNHPRLQGSNVIDWIGKTDDGKTGIRDLFKLFLNAEGSIGLVSFHMHLSGALSKPCIVVAGAREPVHFTRYPGHAYLATDGMLPCAVKACWYCEIKRCTNPVERKDQNGNNEIVPKCVDMIEPIDITRALNNYYTGGRLKRGSFSEKPKFKNIVPTPPKAVFPELPNQKVVVRESKPADGERTKESFYRPEKISGLDPVDISGYNLHGLKWGGSCILQEDWEFILQVIKKYNVKTVLEFGSGLSTLLFHQAGVKVVSYETSEVYASAVRSIYPELDVRLWDGKSIQHDPFYKYDLVFVDGPAGPDRRGDAIRLAGQLGKVAVIHDGNCIPEKIFMEQYLDPWFKEHFKGGRRCHFFASRKDALEMPVNGRIIDLPCELEEMVENSTIAQPDQNPQGKQGIQKRFVKIVSTARGWGGQARSITTIMKLLLEAGHKVEFIPFRNAVTSSELKAMLSNELKNVQVTENYDTIRERCDVLFMYADDYIWEFEKPEIASAFSDIGAERKIMMLNYRRGKVGEIPWTKGWDKYMFLNSSQERELLNVLKRADEYEFPGNIKTKVLPPCTDLEPFFQVIPNYRNGIRIVRHSSQGDTKFDKVNFAGEVDAILASRADTALHFLPGPSFIQPSDRIFKYSRTADPKTIAQFLMGGNLFWYSLPNGYMDMGPRVILEAMAAGLPVIADAWGGALDRVTPETGWLSVEKNQHVEIIKHLSSDEMRRKGEAARDRAYSEFRPEKWIEEILC